MKKRSLIENKKAQDLTIGTLVLVVLGVVVLVLLIIGFTVGFDFIIDKFRIAPGQNLEATAQSCKFSAEGNLKIDYCSFKEVRIEGKKQYINCQDNRVQTAIKDEIDINTDTFCDNFDDARDYCVKNNLDLDETVNGVTCEGYGISASDLKVTCLDIGENDNNGQTISEWRSSGECEKVNQNDLNDYEIVTDQVREEDKNQHQGEVCCLITTP